MNKAERIGELMFRYLRNELSEAETAELKSWRHEQPGHEVFFQQQTDPEWLRQTITGIYAGHDQGLQRLVDEHGVERSLPFRRIMGLRIWQVAASIFVLIVLYKFLTYDWSPPPSQGLPAQQQAHAAEAQGIDKSIEDIKSGFHDGQASAYRAKHFSSIPEWVAINDSTAAPDRFLRLTTKEHGYYMITLPDGSRSWQNINSSVSYPVNFFHGEPKLIIRGEAYIELTPNKSDFSPFVVQAGNISITAFTGRFNLRAYPGDSTITITAIEGALQVKSDSSLIELQPREQLMIAGGKMEISRNADIEKLLKWKTGYRN